MFLHHLVALIASPTKGTVLVKTSQLKVPTMTTTMKSETFGYS
jgi:hypothetical protein